MASTFITSCTPGSSAASLGKKVDAPATALDVGVAALVVRDDAPTTLTVANGDYTQLRVNAEGALHVTGGDGTVTNAGVFPVQETGDSKIYLAQLAGCVGGTELQVDLVNSAACTNAGTFAVQVDGDALTALQSIAGAISGTELQVDLVSAAVTNAGTFAVQVDGDALTALQSIAGAVSGTELQVDLVSAAVTNAGTFATQIDGDALTALQSLAGAFSGTELQVDLVSAAVTNAGTFATQVDGDALTALQSLAGAVSGTELQVDLVSAAVTNAGTFATQVDGDALTALQSLAGAISGTELQVDLVSAAVTNAGTFATQVDALTPGTAAANLGKAADSAAGGTDTGVSILAVRTDTPATITPVAGDYAPLRLNANGSLWVRQEAAASTGSEGNLFNAVSVIAANTSSAAVDTTALGRINILVKGSDLAVTTSFDVYVSGNGGVAWYYDSQIMMSTTDGAGNPLASRFGSLSLDVAGVDRVKLVAHGTETVTASLYGL